MSASYQVLVKEVTTDKYFGGSVCGLDDVKASAIATVKEIVPVSLTPVPLVDQNLIIRIVSLSEYPLAEFTKAGIPKKPLTPDEIVCSQLNALGKNRYRICIGTSSEEFLAEKTGVILESAFQQHEIESAALRFGVPTSLNLRVVVACPFLHSLDLSNWRLSPSQWDNLFAGLSRSDAITHLVLARTMSESSVQIFMALNNFLKVNRSLETLDLVGNHITSDQAMLFSEGVSQSTLKDFCIQENQINATGFCALLGGFKGHTFSASDVMGDEKEDHSAVEQVCKTIAINPHVTELNLGKVSRDCKSDAEIYTALSKSKNITEFSMIDRPHRASDEAMWVALCALLEAKTDLYSLYIDLYKDNDSKRISTSFLKNNRILNRHCSLFNTDEMRLKIQENSLKAVTEKYNWARLAVLIAFVRANQNGLFNSVHPLIPWIARLAGWEEEFAYVKEEEVELRTKLSRKK